MRLRGMLGRMDPGARRLVVTWAVLLVLLGVQAGLGLLRLGLVTPFVGIGMAATVAFAFMHLRQASQLSRTFALAGLFWLLILFGLTATDVLGRVSYPGEFHSEP